MKSMVMGALLVVFAAGSYAQEPQAPDTESPPALPSISSVGVVFEAKVVGVDNAPALTSATQQSPLTVKLRFAGNECWAVADLVPLVGKVSSNVSGRLRGVDCNDGRFKDRQGFAAGFLEVAKPGSLWIAIFDN